MRMIETPWHFWVQEVPCSPMQMAKTRLRLVSLVETKTSYHREDSPRSMKFETKIGRCHHPLNSWRALEEEAARKIRTKMIKSRYLRWIPSACHALGNWLEVSYNASSLPVSHITLPIQFSEVSFKKLICNQTSISQESSSCFSGNSFQVSATSSF